jgi:Tfp pilus assembly protein PilN
MDELLITVAHINPLIAAAIVLLLIFGSVFIELLLFGSSIDPDDNGLLRTKNQKERFRMKKLKKLYKD